MSVIPDSPFGDRVRSRLRDEQVIWFSTVSANGTPQPNPVWFLWDEAADTALIYNAVGAARLAHVAARPEVSLNFDSNGDGGDVVVVAGVAESASDAPAADQNEAYLAKYAAGIESIGTDPAQFARDYATVLRIRFVKVRGF